MSVAPTASGRGFVLLMFCCNSWAKQMAWDKQGGLVVLCVWGGVDGGWL